MPALATCPPRFACTGVPGARARRAADPALRLCRDDVSDIGSVGSLRAADCTLQLALSPAVQGQPLHLLTRWRDAPRAARWQAGGFLADLVEQVG